MYTLSRKGLNALIGFEVGAEFENDTRYYDKFLASPSFPGLQSGVTSGIGYDFGYNTKEQIRKDWEGKVNGNILAYFLSVSGLKGDIARRAITSNVKGFKVPYNVAYEVFVQSTLPRFCKLTESIYPNLKNLNPTTQAMLISLVFNRGTSLQGERRNEMRMLVAATNAAHYEKIASLFNQMKALWVGKSDGLVKRRAKEAQLIKDSIIETIGDIVTIK